MLFSTGSAMALAVDSKTNCDASGAGNCAAMTCSAGTIQNIVTLTAPQGVTAKLSYTSSCTSSDATSAITNCKSACEAIKTASKLADIAAYNKAKLDPMADSKYDTQDQTFSRAMCQALKVVTGSAGKTFASFAIIATGIGFFTGKVSWV